MGKARRWILLAVVIVLALAGAFGAVIAYRWQKPRIRGEIIALLTERLGAQVDLADFDLTLGADVTITGGGLVLHHYRHPDRPPLVRVERFELSVPLLAILHKPVHVTQVRLLGMRIVIPPRAEGEARADTSRLRLGGPSPVVIDTLQTQDVVLEIESRKPDRPPRTFLIHDLTLSAAAFDRPVHYEAHLTNPKPTGAIRASGDFGPWEADEPTLTHLRGDYVFSHADLSTIKGIGGSLDSTGTFGGRLEQIDVTGETRTPDFSLDVGGQPVPLVTKFIALVDGTNGDTVLNDVDAILGATPLRAKGGVVHMPGRKGRTIALDVTIDRGRLEDILRLAIDDKVPPMSGALGLRTKLDLPPGEGRVPDRLQLAGEFSVTTLRFASDAVQNKIDEFSRRGRGKPTDTTIRDVPSNMRGHFELKNGVLRLQNLAFTVRGAVVFLDGHYVLRGGALDFRGTVRLDARASQTMTGWKKWVTKVFDPLLAKGGAGTVLPIKVTGTAKQPKFGVEMKKIF